MVSFKQTLAAVATAAFTIEHAAARPTSIGPTGPCPDSKVDAILNGKMDASECCSYGICKGEVVIAVGH